MRLLHYMKFEMVPAKHIQKPLWKDTQVGLMGKCQKLVTKLVTKVSKYLNL